jgi:hypothetical protein
MGFSLSSGFTAAIPLSSFLDRFLCSIWNPVSSPRPAVLQKPTRAGAVKVGRRTNLSTPSTFARPYLDSSEHGGTLKAVGMTIRGGARLRSRGLIAPHPCMRWIQGIRTMMQIYASAARLRSSGAQSFDRHESHAMVRATATSDRAWRIARLKAPARQNLNFFPPVGVWIPPLLMPPASTQSLQAANLC